MSSGDTFSLLSSVSISGLDFGLEIPREYGKNKHILQAISKKHLTPNYGVASLFKVLTPAYAALFHRLAPCP